MQNLAMIYCPATTERVATYKAEATLGDLSAWTISDGKNRMLTAVLSGTNRARRTKLRLRIVR